MVSITLPILVFVVCFCVLSHTQTHSPPLSRFKFTIQIQHQLNFFVFLMELKRINAKQWNDSNYRTFWLTDLSFAAAVGRHVVAMSKAITKTMNPTKYLIELIVWIGNAIACHMRPCLPFIRSFYLPLFGHWYVCSFDVTINTHDTTFIKN